MITPRNAAILVAIKPDARMPGVSFWKYVCLLLHDTWRWNRANVAGHIADVTIAFLTAAIIFRITGQRSDLTQFLSFAGAGLAFWIFIELLFAFFIGGWRVYRRALDELREAENQSLMLRARLDAGPNVVADVSEDFDHHVELSQRGLIAGAIHTEDEGVSMIVLHCHNDPASSASTAVAEAVSGEIAFYHEARDEPFANVPLLWFTDNGPSLLRAVFEKSCRFAIGEKRKAIIALKLLSSDDGFYLTEDVVGGNVLHSQARLGDGRWTANIRVRGTGVNATWVVTFRIPSLRVHASILTVEGFRADS